MEQRRCGVSGAADRLECGVLDVGSAVEDIDLGRVGRMVVVGVISMVLVVAGFGLAPLRGGADDGRLEPLSPTELGAVVAVAESVTFAVETERCGVSIRGSGVVIGSRLVTNRHLGRGAEKLLVTGVAVGGVAPSGQAVIGRRSARLDLVLADRAGSGEWGEGVEIAEQDPAVGEPVVVAGRFPDGLRWMAARVHLVVDGSAYGLDGRVLLVDVPTVPGFSGGPVLDRDGDLVGVLQAVDRSTALALAVPVSELAAWLDGADDMQADMSCMGGSRHG